MSRHGRLLESDAARRSPATGVRPAAGGAGKSLTPGAADPEGPRLSKKKAPDDRVQGLGTV
jgi:hypothetical protein